MWSEPDPQPAPGLVSIERRSISRLPTRDEPARIAWKAGGLRMGQAPARLIDITARGAGLLAQQPAQLGQLVWLGITSLPGEWVKATIRAAVPHGSQWQYHLAFCEPCPAGLLEQAIHGSPSIRDNFRSVIFEDDDVD
jgi:hypothetical protein